MGRECSTHTRTPTHTHKSGAQIQIQNEVGGRGRETERGEMANSHTQRTHGRVLAAATGSLTWYN